MSILIVILVLAILIFIHEFGHFITAKWSGLRVEEFGFGFPPRIFGKKKGGTIYSVNWIPFGGFVKIYGEEGEGEGDPDSFISQPVWRRFLVVVAGVAMNFLLGWFLISAVFSVGARTAVDDSTRLHASDVAITITGVAKDSPAEKAGLAPGDRLVKIEDPQLGILEINTLQKFVEAVDGSRGRQLEFTVLRGSEAFEANVFSRPDPPQVVNGCFAPREGPVGIQITETGVVRYSFFRSIREGLTTSLYISSAVLMAIGGMLKDVFVSGKVCGDVVGPVGLVDVTSDAVKLGLLNLIQLVALISLNLATLNLLPIPALDGGRLLFLIIEKLKGSPVPRRFERFVHAAGFALLIILMVVITINDVTKLL